MKRALLLLPSSSPPARCRRPRRCLRQQVHFGIEVAQKGLWRRRCSASRGPSKLDPQNASALNNLAVALEQMGEFDEARESYERALELKPDDLYIQQNYDLFREADDKRNRKSEEERPDMRSVALALLGVVLLLRAGCASFVEVPVETPLQSKLDVTRFRRILIAGFVTDLERLGRRPLRRRPPGCSRTSSARTPGLQVLEPDRPPLHDALEKVARAAGRGR